MYSTDNGAEKFTWPDGGTSPFRGEKNTNWEGGYRVPCAIRWPGVIKPGTVLNDIFAHEDMLPTLLAAAGEPDVKEQAAEGHARSATRRSRCTSTATTSPTRSPARRRARARSSSTSTTTARWSRCATTSGRSSSPSSARTASTSGRSRSSRCACPSSSTCAPIRSRLADHEGMDYERWRVEHVFLLVPAQQYVGQFLTTFKEFPPSQKAGQLLARPGAGSHWNPPATDDGDESPARRYSTHGAAPASTGRCGPFHCRGKKRYRDDLRPLRSHPSAATGSQLTKPLTVVRYRPSRPGR